MHGIYLIRSRILVGAIGIEPTTPTMSRWCSNHLSYAPSSKSVLLDFKEVRIIRFAKLKSSAEGINLTFAMRLASVGDRSAGRRSGCLGDDRLLSGSRALCQAVVAVRRGEITQLWPPGGSAALRQNDERHVMLSRQSRRYWPAG